MSEDKSKNLGWECPACGRCYAPFAVQCQHCGPDKQPTEEERKAFKLTTPNQTERAPK